MFRERGYHARNMFRNRDASGDAWPGPFEWRRGELPPRG
jgi:hypothetical protein